MGIQEARILVKAKPLVMLARSCSEKMANKWLRDLGEDAQTELGLFMCMWEGAASAGNQRCCAVSNVAKVLDRAAEEKSAHAAGQGLGGFDYQSASPEDRCAAVAAVQQAGKDEAQKILAARQVAISADRKALVESLGGMCTEEDVDAVHSARTECATRLEAAEEARDEQESRARAAEKDLRKEGLAVCKLRQEVQDLKTQVEVAGADVERAMRALAEGRQRSPQLDAFFGTSAQKHLQAPEITGKDTPVAFEIMVPTRNEDGRAELRRIGGVLDEEDTDAASIHALVLLFSLVHKHIVRYCVQGSDGPCSKDGDVLRMAQESSGENLPRLLRALVWGDAAECGQPFDEQRTVVQPWVVSQLVHKWHNSGKNGGLQDRAAYALFEDTGDARELFFRRLGISTSKTRWEEAQGKATQEWGTGMVQGGPDSLGYTAYDNLGYDRKGGPTKSKRFETVPMSWKVFTWIELQAILGDEVHDSAKWMEKEHSSLKVGDYMPSEEAFAFLAERWGLELDEAIDLACAHKSKSDEIGVDVGEVFSCRHEFFVGDGGETEETSRRYIDLEVERQEAVLERGDFLTLNERNKLAQGETVIGNLQEWSVLKKVVEAGREHVQRIVDGGQCHEDNFNNIKCMTTAEGAVIVNSLCDGDPARKLARAFKFWQKLRKEGRGRPAVTKVRPWEDPVFENVRNSAGPWHLTKESFTKILNAVADVFYRELIKTFRPNGEGQEAWHLNCSGMSIVRAIPLHNDGPVCNMNALYDRPV